MSVNFESGLAYGWKLGKVSFTELEEQFDDYYGSLEDYFIYSNGYSDWSETGFGIKYAYTNDLAVIDEYDIPSEEAIEEMCKIFYKHFPDRVGEKPGFFIYLEIS